MRATDQFTSHDIGELHHTPIPLDSISTEDWQTVPIRDNGEPLVPMGVFSGTGIYTDSIYASEHSSSPYDSELKGSLLTVSARQGVVNTLQAIEERLSDGLHLVVFDGYRSTDLQQVLFDNYYRTLAESYPDWGDEALLTEAQKYVSLPVEDATQPSPHNTGGAVDAALFWLPPQAEERLKKIDEAIAKAEPDKQVALRIGRHNLIASRGILMDFGVPFDHMGPEAALTYYETADQDHLSVREQAARNHRRLLFHIMTLAGLQPYEHEWWHFNAALSQMGAVVIGNAVAEYGPVEPTLSLETIERERRHMQPFLQRSTRFPLAASIGQAETV